MDLIILVIIFYPSFYPLLLSMLFMLTIFFFVITITLSIVSCMFQSPPLVYFCLRCCLKKHSFAILINLLQILLLLHINLNYLISFCSYLSSAKLHVDISNWNFHVLLLFIIWEINWWHHVICPGTLLQMQYRNHELLLLLRRAIIRINLGSHSPFEPFIMNEVTFLSMFSGWTYGTFNCFC